MIFYLEKRDSNPHVTNYGQWFIIINIMLISVNENYKIEGICGRSFVSKVNKTYKFLEPGT